MPKHTEVDPEDDIDQMIAARTGELPLGGPEYNKGTPPPEKPSNVAPAKPVQPQSVSPEPAKTIEPLKSKLVTLPDGSLRGVITISVENAELLRTWAEGAGTDLTEYVNE